MADPLTTCLLRAIRAVQELDIDADARESITEGLRAVVAREYKSTSQRIIAAEHAAFMAKRRALMAKLTKDADDRGLERFNSTVINRDRDDPKSVAAAAARARRLISPAIGDEGLADRAAIASLLRQENAEISAELDPVWKVLTDTYGSTGYTKLKDSERAAMFDYALRGGDVDDPEIQAAVATLRGVIEPRLERLREAGLWTDVIKDWAWQTHNNSRIESDFANWKQYRLQHLDRERHPDPEATAPALYERLYTREFDSTGSGKTGAQRKIWMDSPESEHEYAMRYGDPGISQNLIAAVQKLAADVVLAEELLPNIGKLAKESTGEGTSPMAALRADVERMP